MPDWVRGAYMALTPRGRAIVAVATIAAAAALIWKFGWPL